VQRALEGESAEVPIDVPNVEGMVIVRVGQG
jgi:hypothetical protein